ncbi:FAD-dependent oxidoreductase [Nitrincola tapanii]|uniref:Ferredoxin-NADP reductase n=1 Tax=Nitrincola tapanii TaxID=1708751 RepID=A0A5A9W535_9GAMM|nr:FAD-dependent oxidoreductase [Nitrincola tapanii]KAA0875886.1 ferredoxin-NADP reductase [Nitrincola tapanii]
MLKIAIIGSGPAACFSAEILSSKRPDLEIHIFERLAQPFGLVEYGVAPDHAITRQIKQSFTRTLAKPQIHLHTQCEIGVDRSFASLQSEFPWILIATGALEDRALKIPGEHLPGVYGSAELVTWYNQHPEQAALHPKLGKRLAIIGQGNVALDLARVLCKTTDEMQEAISQPSIRAERNALQQALQEIWILGRRGPVEAGFSLPELKELGELDAALPTLRASDLENIDLSLLPHSKQQVLQQLKLYSQNLAEPGRCLIRFMFQVSPLALHADAQGHLASMTLMRNHLKEGRAIPSGETLELPIHSLVKAIGYQSRPLDDLPFDQEKGHFIHEEGEIAPGIFCVGWCKRGSQGVIPVNRSDAMAVARKLLSQLPPAS